MSSAGAHVVGVNCHFDPFVTLRTMAEMKRGLVDAGLFADPRNAGHNKYATRTIGKVKLQGYIS